MQVADNDDDDDDDEDENDDVSNYDEKDDDYEKEFALVSISCRVMMMMMMMMDVNGIMMMISDDLAWHYCQPDDGRLHRLLQIAQSIISAVALTKYYKLQTIPNYYRLLQIITNYYRLPKT